LRFRPQACRDGFSVLYKRASRLFTDLAQARGEDWLPRLMSALERTRLLLSWWPGGESDRLAYLFASQAQTKSCIAW
jgi:hypothetical protein